MPRPSVPTSFTRRSSHEVDSVDLKLKLLTPMIGGAAEAGTVNTGQPFRMSELKHQLRFWWRALQPLESTVEELRNREFAIFGGAADESAEAGSYASKVKLQPIHSGNVVGFTANQNALRTPQLPYPPYGVGPLLQDHNAEIGMIQAGAECTVRLEFSNNPTTVQRKEVEAALRAAIFFGGMGARTRRGFGSLHGEKSTGEKLCTVGEWEKLLGSFPRLNACAAGRSFWPSLHGAMLWTRRMQDQNVERAWCSLVQQFGEFRQGRGVGRGQGAGNTPGRSFWPEPDSIRNWLPFHSLQHPVRHPSANGWYPRTAYGMPLAIHFKRNGRADPAGTATLAPPGADRWPSPVILKVIRLQDGEVLQICLWLNQNAPGMDLTWKPENNGGFPNAKGPVPLPRTAGSDDFAGKVMVQKPSRSISNVHPVAALADHLNLALVP